VSLFEQARALGARSPKARVAEAGALAALNEELGGRIPAWYIDLLTTVPLCGFEITVPADDGESEHHLEFLDGQGMRRETLGTHQRELIEGGGYVAIAYDCLYYDTYFLKTPCSDDPQVYQIDHETGEAGVPFKLAELLAQAQPYVEPPPMQAPPRPAAVLQLRAGRQLRDGFRGSGYDALRELREKLPPDLPEVKVESYSVFDKDPRDLADYEYELCIHGRGVARGTCNDFNFRKLRDHLRKVILEHAVELRTPAPEGTVIAVAPGLAVAVEGFAVQELPRLSPGQFLVAVDGRWRHFSRVEPERLLQYGESLWGPAETTFQGLPARWIDEEDEERARAAGAAVATPEEVVRWTTLEVLSRVE